MRRNPPKQTEAWACLAALLLSSATGSATMAPTGPEVGATVFTCIACNMPIGAAAVHLQHRGRQVHLHEGLCLDHWHDSADLLFAKLQARGALFDESALLETASSNAWLYFGLYVVAGLVAGALCAYVAISRGRAGLPWFVAGLLGNVAAVVMILTRSPVATGTLPEKIPPGLRKVPLTHSPVPCPDCSHPNHPAAHRCAGCGVALQPTATAEVFRV